MADNVTANAGAGGAVFATDDALGVHHPYVKVEFGADNTQTPVSAANPMPVVQTGTHTVTGAGGTFPVTDSGGALTVDWAGTAPPIGAGLEATALRVTLATDSTGLVSVDDNAGSLTVDNAGLTELAAAINASSQMDVNIAASAATLTVASHAVTNAGTFAVQESGGALTALQLIDNTIVAVDAVAATSVSMVGAVRDDALSTLTPVEGDAVALRTDSTGALWVAATAGAAQKLDDAAFTLATDAVIMVGAIRDDSLATLTAIEGDAVPLRVSSTGALHVTGGGGGTEYTVDAAAPAAPTGGAVLMERDDALSALTEIEGDWTNLRSDANGALWVNPGTVTVASHAVTNAGTFATQVDGAALTALQLIDDVVFAEDVAATAADKGVAILAVRRDADTSLVGTDNDYANLQVDANGYLKVEVFDGGGSHTVDNAGTFAVQVDGSALTALQVIDNPVLVDDAAFTPATSSVMMAGFEADEASTDSVDEGDAGAARMTLDRKVIVTPQPHTGGGLSIFRSIDLDETEEEVKATAGCVYAMWVSNLATTTRFLKFYNATAANVTVGTTTPVITWPIPGNTTDDISAVFGMGMGIMFDTAITVAATTALADADTGAPAANDVVVNIFYK